jgi:glycosyltransferase involved in cell wall biosynthesis
MRETSSGPADAEVSARLRLCFVCGEYPPGAHGGIGTCIQVLGRALVRAGHSVRVIGVYPAGQPGASEEEDHGVRVWRLPEPSYPGGWIKARWQLYRTIAGWARSGDVDLIEVTDWRGPAAWWPRLAVPVVTRVHGSASFLARELHAAGSRSDFWLERASLRRADSWCSPSRYAAEGTRQTFGLATEPRAILPNPVELLEPLARPRSPGANVVFAGTLTANKGVLSLIDAWSRVLRERGDARLQVYGKDGRTATGGSMEAHLRARLEPMVRSTVRFHGHVPRDVLRDALATADVAVFPSYSEAFGLAPFEALAQSCPIVYTRRGPGPELLREGYEALLVDPDDPKDIAAAITRILNDPELGGRLASAGRDRVRREYSIDALVKRNELFYRDCCRAFRASVRMRGRPRLAGQAS